MLRAVLGLIVCALAGCGSPRPAYYAPPSGEQALPPTGIAPSATCEPLLAGAKETNLASLYEQLRAGVRGQGEFERSDALAARAAPLIERRADLTQVNGKPAIVATAAWPRPWVKYNADAGEITMERRTYSRFIEIDGIFAPGSRMFDFIATRYAFQRGGSYVAQNAFGVSANVEQVHHGKMGLAWPAAPLSLKNRWNLNAPLVLRATPDEARGLVDDLGFRIIAEIGPPYWVDYNSRSTPTLTAPTDARYSYKAVVAEPRCLAIVRVSTGEVLRLY